MAIGLRSTEKRGWLPPRKDGAPSRPGWGCWSLRPLSLLLAGYPTIYLLLIFWSVVLSPAFLSIKSNPHSGHDPVMLLVGAFCLATLVANLFWTASPGAKAIRRQLVWQPFLAAVRVDRRVIVGAFLVSTKLIWETNVWRFLTHNWFLLPGGLCVRTRFPEWRSLWKVAHKFPRGELCRYYERDASNPGLGELTTQRRSRSFRRRCPDLHHRVEMWRAGRDGDSVSHFPKTAPFWKTRTYTQATREGETSCV